jgi:hypothetical protein
MRFPGASMRFRTEREVDDHMLVREPSPEGDDERDENSKGPNRRRLRRSGPWVLALLLRVLVEWWFSDH